MKLTPDGGSILGFEPIYATAPAASKNTICIRFKSGQN